mmetsp:Transcript_3509/g.8429  ORF Transcript_3509/g.8429 Transcript_3509/m.8429 type:complete len:336 (+) Transcript_3509:310-1317(+)
MKLQVCHPLLESAAPEKKLTDVETLRRPLEAGNALKEFLNRDLAIACVVQEIEECFQVPRSNLELVQEELQLSILKEDFELRPGEKSISRCIQGLEDFPHVLHVLFFGLLLFQKQDLFVTFCNLHCLLHENGIDDIDNGEADAASVDEEEKRVPLGDVLDQDTTSWSPIRKEHLEEGEHCNGEGAVVLVHFLASLFRLVHILQVRPYHETDDHGSDELNHQEEEQRPYKGEPAGTHASSEQAQRVQHARNLQHADRPEQLRETAKTQESGIHRQVPGEQLHQRGQESDKIDNVEGSLEECRPQKEEPEQDLRREEYKENAAHDLKKVHGPRPCRS